MSLNTVHSRCKAISFMSWFTHSLKVFLPLLPSSPVASLFLQTDTQSSPLLRSRCSNHLSLSGLSSFTTLWKPIKHTTPHTSYDPVSNTHLQTISWACSIAPDSYSGMIVCEYADATRRYVSSVYSFKLFCWLTGSRSLEFMSYVHHWAYASYQIIIGLKGLLFIV